MPKQREQFMTVLGGYTLDMYDHGRLIHQSVPVANGRDYGADPIGDGTFRMVPSGDIVTSEERDKRLGRN